MTDKINVTIECGGYTITGEVGRQCIHLVANPSTKRAWYESTLIPWILVNGKGSLDIHSPFFIESDVPGALHKFKGVEYLGLVDAPRNYTKMLKDLLEKFMGALVIFDGQYVMVVYKDVPILSGCSSIFQCLTGGGATNLMRYNHTSGVGQTWSLRSTTVSLEMEAAAKDLGNQFVLNYERLMAF